MHAPATSPVLQAFDRRQALAKSDPLLALAYWIEAAGDRRTGDDVLPASLLTEARDRARLAIQRATGEAFTNPLFPVRRS